MTDCICDCGCQKEVARGFAFCAACLAHPTRVEIELEEVR